MTSQPTAHRIWSEVWRLIVALVLGIVSWVVVAGISLDLGAADADGAYGLRLIADLLIGVVAVAFVALRRYVPVTAGVITAVCAAFSSFAVPAALIVLISVSTGRRWRSITIVAGVWVAAAVAVESVGLSAIGFVSTTRATPGEVGIVAAVLIAIVAAAVAVGLAIGTRRALLESLTERARLAEVEQRLRAERIRERERERIAREMHDVLAHQLSIVALHAGALRDRRDLAGDESVEAIAIIHDRSRRALSDLREVLGTLREGDAAGERMPQPTFDDIPALVAEEPAARLELAVAGDAVVPARLGRHTYRIVQECLTNARKHAPAQPVIVRIAGTPGVSMTIDATNPIELGREGGPPGYGLLGIEERARSLAGSSEVSREGGTHRVAVVLPWTQS